ncbi:MAG: cobalamin transport system ATP-binding protein [Actinomycetota bacterium]|jgi:iron complex transport system ATP-binding protein
MVTAAIRAKDVSVDLGGATVLYEVDLEVGEGEWVVVIGPNGAGKTTLLKAIAGLVPFKGAVEVLGEPPHRRGRRASARRVAYVPQDPLIPAGMSVLDYVLLGRTAHLPYLGIEGKRDHEVVDDVLERLDLTDVRHRPVDSLSGGEQQRAVLARALAQQAPVLLLDEPTSALDVGHQQQVLELVETLRTDTSLAVVSAMHDLTLAGQFADRLLLLAGGRAVATGPARTVLTEQALSEHWGARVRVLDDPEGGIVVVPIRARNGGDDDRHAAQ